MESRVNVIIPEALYAKSIALVEDGYFSNFSELVRAGLRKEVKEYEDREPKLSEDERKLFTLLKKADKEGLLLNEEDMKKHGLSI